MAAATTRSQPLVCRGHTRPLTCLSFSGLEADGEHYLLISGCKDGTPMLRDGATGDWLGSFLGHRGSAWSAKLSANTQRAISGSADFSAKIWDATDGSCLLTLPHEHIVRCVDLNTDGSKAVTGGHEKKLRLWDVAQLLAAQQDQQGKGGQTEQAVSADSITLACSYFIADASKSTAHEGNIKFVIWDEPNGQVVSAGDDKTVKFWSLMSMKCEHVLHVDAPITSMERCHDQAGSISLTHGDTVAFIDARAREIRLSYTLPYPVSTASLHPISHDRFVTGSSADGWVRVHDAKTGAEREMYKGHHGPVHAISYSPDGELYASGSEDGTIRLWQTTPKTYGLWVAGATTGN